MTLHNMVSDGAKQVLKQLDIKSYMSAATFRAIDRISSSWITLQWFILANIYIPEIRLRKAIQPNQPISKVIQPKQPINKLYK